MHCQRCQTPRPTALAFCPDCGHPYADLAGIGGGGSPAAIGLGGRSPGPVPRSAPVLPAAPLSRPDPAVVVGPPPEAVSPANREVALLLAILPLMIGGIGGIHRFYTGRIGSGLVQLFTGGGFLIWTIIDVVHLCQNRFRDASERLVVSRPLRGSSPAWPVPPSVPLAPQHVPVRG